MSLEKANLNWSAKNIKNMVVKGNIDFNHIVQRSYVWERKRKTALIESMILGYPVPPIFAKRIDDGSGKKATLVYSIMDGKQRLSTVAQFLNDEFALSDLEPVLVHDEETDKDIEVNISGCKFSELPESLKDHLNTVMFSVTYFDNLTKEEERELFKRLNAGKPLSVKSQLLASCNDIEGLMDIGSHPLFAEMLTDKARDNKNQVTVVMKAWCMLTMPVEEISFESKQFNPLFETSDISAVEKVALNKVFDLIVATHAALVEKKEKATAKKLYTETQKFYVFCGCDKNERYDEAFWKQDVENLFERIFILKTFNCKPYIMRFEKVYESEYNSFYATVASWCNQPSIFRTFPFRLYAQCRAMRSGDYKKYKRDIDRYLKEVGWKGAEWRSMEMIENRFPEIAEKYFDFTGKPPSKYEWLDILLSDEEVE